MTPRGSKARMRKSSTRVEMEWKWSGNRVEAIIQGGNRVEVGGNRVEAKIQSRSRVEIEWKRKFRVEVEWK